MVKLGIDRKSSLRSGSRLIQRAEQRQSGGEMKMREGMISIGLNAAAQPYDCFCIGAEVQLGEAHNM